jgi:hypothetical protein
MRINWVTHPTYAVDLRDFFQRAKVAGALKLVVPRFVCTAKPLYKLQPVELGIQGIEVR